MSHIENRTDDNDTDVQALEAIASELHLDTPDKLLAVATALGEEGRSGSIDDFGIKAVE